MSRIAIAQIDELVGRMQKAFDNGGEPPRSVLEDLISDARDMLREYAKDVETLENVESELRQISDDLDDVIRMVRS